MFFVWWLWAISETDMPFSGIIKFRLGLGCIQEMDLACLQLHFWKLSNEKEEQLTGFGDVKSYSLCTPFYPLFEFGWQYF